MKINNRITSRMIINPMIKAIHIPAVLVAA
jgi:hypothetical protein